MTTLRNSLFTELYINTECQCISRNQRHPTKKCPNNKHMHFSFNYFLYINQLIKRYKNAPDDISEGRPDNNYYEAERPRN
jgi:hypothetical protein